MNTENFSDVETINPLWSHYCYCSQLHTFYGMLHRSKGRNCGFLQNWLLTCLRIFCENFRSVNL